MSREQNAAKGPSKRHTRLRGSPKTCGGAPCTGCLVREGEDIDITGPAAAVRAAPAEVQVSEGAVGRLARALGSGNADLPSILALANERHSCKQGSS